MIVKRSNRTSQPPEAPAGIIQRFAAVRAEMMGHAPGNAADGSGGLLSPSRWVVLTSQIPAMAAALAYRTIFGIIPILVIGLMVIGAYAEEKEITAAVGRVLQFAGLDQVAVDSQEPVAPSSPNDAGSPQVATPGTRTEPDGAASPPPASSQRLDQWIASLVKQVRTIPFRTIGFVGLVALIYAALSMLVEIERAFNQIYRVPAGRAWWSRVTRYWTLLTLGSIGLFATFYATDAFMSRIDKVQSWSIGELIHRNPATPEEAGPPVAAESDVAAKPAEPAALPPPGDGVKISGETGVFSVRTTLGYAITVLITTMFMTVIYSVVPNARVRLSSALSGAFVAALLWETAKWAFTFYVKSAGYTRLYGALALLPLFLLWVYVAWMITLLGLFISYTLQSRGARPAALSTRGTGVQAIVDPATILLVAGSVGRQFKGGKSSDAAEVARSTGLDQQVVVSMLEALVARGVLHRIATGDDEERFALARPPEAITIAECLTIAEQLVDMPRARSLSSPGMDQSLAAMLRPLDQARDEAARGRTLAEFLGISAPAVEGAGAKASTGDAGEKTREPAVPVSGPPGARTAEAT